MDIMAEITAFTAVLQARGYRAATIKHYTGYVRRMLRWLAEQPGADGARPGEEAVRAFLIDLASNTTYSSTTYNIAFNAVRHYLIDCCGIERPQLGLKAATAAGGAAAGALGAIGGGPQKGLHSRR